MLSRAQACMQRGFRATFCSMLLLVLISTVQASLASPTSILSTQKDGAYSHSRQPQQQTASLAKALRRVKHAQKAEDAALLSIERGRMTGLAAVQATARTAIWRRVMRATANDTEADVQEPQVASAPPSDKIQQHSSTIASSGSQGAVHADGFAADRSNSTSSSTAVSSRNEAGSLPMDITSGTVNTTAALYDQQVLVASSSNQAMIFQRFNASVTSSLPEGKPGQQDIAPQDGPANDPPHYAFPAPTRYRTVYFEATLHTFIEEALGSTNKSFNDSALTASEQAAFGVAVNSFLTSNPGELVAKTDIKAMVTVANGLRMSVGIEILTGDENLQHFLAETVNADPNMIWPTSIWGKITTAAVSEQSPTGLNALAYSWFVEQYSNCSQLCGGGVQTRNVLCKESSSSEPVDPAYCAHTPAPANSRPCQEQPCQSSLPTEYTLMLGDWGACNSTCGLGSRSRSAMCVSKEGFIGSLLDCFSADAIADLWEDLWQPCTQLPPCPSYFWSYSDWVCNNTAGCGGGVASRTASCMQAGTHSEVDDILCDPAELDTSTQACASYPCHVYYWRSQELGDCLPEEESNPCGRHVQRRVFDCINMTSGEGANNQMCSGPKPELGDVECQGPVNCTEGSSPEPAPVPLDSSGSSDTDYSDSHGTNSGNNAENEAPASGDGGTLTPATSTAAADSSSSSNGSSDAGSGTPGADISNTSAVAAGEHPEKPAKPQASSDAPGGFTMSQGSNWGGNGGVSSAAVAPDAPASPVSGSSNSGAASGTGSSLSSNNTAAGGNITTAAQAGYSEPASAIHGNSGTGSTGSASMPNSNSGSTSQNSANVQNGVVAPPVVFDLGPGQMLPDWLLQTPTAALQALLDCPKKFAISVNGKCCGGKQLDSKGMCCDGVVDACGACNGNGKNIDALGTCCPGTLDAKGICCLSTVDECGVCNGTNACDLKVEFTAALPNPSVYLAPNSPSNRRLKVAIEDAVAKALSTVNGRSFDMAQISATLSAFTPPAPVGKPTVVQGNAKPDATGAAGEYMVPQQSNVAAATWKPFPFQSPFNDTGNAVSSKVADKLGVPASSSSGEQKPVPAALAGGTVVPPLNAFNTYTITTLGPDSSAVSAIIPAGSTNSAASGASTSINNDFTSSSGSEATAGEPVQAEAEGQASHEQPMQVDTLPSDGQSVGHNAIKANNLQPHSTRFNSGRQPGADSGTTWFQVERAVERVLHTSAGGIKLLINGLEDNDNSTAASGSSAAGSGSNSSSAPLEPASRIGVPPVATSSNTIVVTLTVQTMAGMTGVDTGLALLALNRLAGTSIAVPSSSSKLTLRKITLLARQGKCGDGICQVGERPAYGNTNACSSDCVLPFMSCPLGTEAQLCSGRGICFNSIGSCSCTAGYSGADCSACALHSKMVNGYCVAAQLLAPPRLGSTDLTTGDNMLKQVTNQQQSMLGGRLAVTLVTVCTLACVAYAARIVHIKRRQVIKQRVGEQETVKADNYVAD